MNLELPWVFALSKLNVSTIANHTMLPQLNAELMDHLKVSQLY